MTKNKKQKIQHISSNKYIGIYAVCASICVIVFVIGLYRHKQLHAKKSSDSVQSTQPPQKADQYNTYNRHKIVDDVCDDMKSPVSAHLLASKQIRCIDIFMPLKEDEKIYTQAIQFLRKYYNFLKYVRFKQQVCFNLNSNIPFWRVHVYTVNFIDTLLQIYTKVLNNTELSEDELYKKFIRTTHKSQHTKEAKTMFSDFMLMWKKYVSIVYR